MIVDRNELSKKTLEEILDLFEIYNMENGKKFDYDKVTGALRIGDTIRISGYNKDYNKDWNDIWTDLMTDDEYKQEVIAGHIKGVEYDAERDFYIYP